MLTLYVCLLIFDNKNNDRYGLSTYTEPGRRGCKTLDMNVPTLDLLCVTGSGRLPDTRRNIDKL